MKDLSRNGRSYRRILLKLSGESLLGEKSYGIDEKILAVYAQEVKEVVDAGVELAIVIGGGRSEERRGRKECRSMWSPYH